jgi:hypothetical protein
LVVAERANLSGGLCTRGSPTSSLATSSPTWPSQPTGKPFLPPISALPRLENKHNFFSYRMVDTLIKKKIKFSSYKEIQKGAVAKSYMRKGFLIYEKMCKFL